MEQNQEQEDVIPESRAARWAWRVSLIPLFGIPLFIALAFLALYRIGSKGRTGFWLLRRGVIAVLLINIFLYFGFYLLGFSGTYNYAVRPFYSWLPKHGYYQDVFTQQEYFFGAKHGKYICIYPFGEMDEGEYKNGQPDGTWTSWLHGIKRTEFHYKNGCRVGKSSFFDEKGQITDDLFYENDKLIKSVEHKDGQLVRISHIKNGQRVQTTFYKDGQPVEEQN